jgi:phosphohistidine phosphatase
MRTLVLMRHAQSGHPGGVRDHDRPLTESGRTAAGLAGDWLRSNLDPIDEVLCSTALRAQQTARATGTAAPIRSELDVYDATPRDVLRVLRTTGAAVLTLLVVGHAPGIPALAVQLIVNDGSPGEAGQQAAGEQGAADQLQVRFPTAALAVLQFAGEWAELDEGAARLTFFRIPPD